MIKRLLGHLLQWLYIGFYAQLFVICTPVTYKYVSYRGALCQQIVCAHLLAFHGSVVSKFRLLCPSAARQELAGAIRGRGAFRRFKNGIYYHQLNQQWYDS